MKRALIYFISFFFIVSLKADYPLFWQQYAADPSGIEYNGRLYLFCSHDTYHPDKGYGYFMRDITCISTDDLKNWTDHGEVFSIENAKWAPRFTWAPCVVFHEGKFFLYYGNGDQGIGVATSESPIGPYYDPNDGPIVDFSTPGVLAKDSHGNLIKNERNVRGALQGSENWGIWCFDPCVWIEDDGQPYMYFGGAHPNNSRIIKLKSNMVEVDGAAIHPNTPGFFEASFMHKFKDKYYYSYAGHYFGKPASIEYVVGESPVGIFKEPGIILPNPPSNDGYNNHHSIFQFKKNWYIAYHNRQVAYEKGQSDKRAREYMRSICLDRLIHNEDGSIQLVKITKDGLPQLKYVNPFQSNEAETMAKGIGIKTLNKEDNSQNRVVCFSNEGYIKIRGVDFQKGASQFYASIKCMLLSEGTIELHLEGINGLLIGKLLVSSVSYGNTWKNIKTRTHPNQGVNDLYIVYKGKGNIYMDNWQFLKQ